MAAQSTGPEFLTAQDWQEILSSPTFGESGATTRTEPPAVSKVDNKPLKREERKAVLSWAVLQIALADSDDRLEFLGSLNPALTESDLDRIAIVREQWLNGEGRDRLRGLALRCYEKEWQPSEMLPQVSTTEELDRLAALLSQTEISDKTLAVCYLIVEAYDVACAAYVIHRERETGSAAPEPVQQSPEEMAGDLQFTRLR